MPGGLSGGGGNGRFWNRPIHYHRWFVCEESVAITKLSENGEFFFLRQEKALVVTGAQVAMIFFSTELS